jgi:predicted regulator of Ras-like GTPase activity (Roadblock/LC7/MglB family)
MERFLLTPTSTAHRGADAELIVENVTGIKKKIATSGSTEAIVRTTGDGNVRESSGTPRAELEEVSAALDILMGALQVSGHRLVAGSFRDAVLTFDDGILIIARDEGQASLAVLAESGASAGLLLNQVRRLLHASRDGSSGGSK